MALISCPECQHRVSTAASTCPSCGYPLADRGKVGTHDNAPFNAGTVGRLATVLGAWLLVPHVARLLAIVAFCIMVVFVGYFALRGGGS